MLIYDPHLFRNTRIRNGEAAHRNIVFMKMENVKTPCQHSETRPDRRERSSVHLQQVFLHREGAGSKFQNFETLNFFISNFEFQMFFDLFVVQLIHRNIIHERVENEVNSVKNNPKRAYE